MTAITVPRTATSRCTESIGRPDARPPTFKWNGLERRVIDGRKTISGDLRTLCTMRINWSSNNNAKAIKLALTARRSLPRIASGRGVSSMAGHCLLRIHIVVFGQSHGIWHAAGIRLCVIFPFFRATFAGAS